MRGISHLSISRFTGTRLDFVQHCSHSLWVRGCLVLLTVTPLCHSVTVVWLWGARKVFYWSANHSTSSELNNCAERHLSGVTISPFTNETLSFMIVCCRFFKFTWNTNHSLLIFGPFSPILQSGSIRETTQITHSTILWGYSKVHEISMSQADETNTPHWPLCAMWTYLIKVLYWGSWPCSSHWYLSAQLWCHHNTQVNTLIDSLFRCNGMRCWLINICPLISGHLEGLKKKIFKKKMLLALRVVWALSAAWSVLHMCNSLSRDQKEVRCLTV